MHDDRYLPSWVLQLTGILVLVALVATKTESPLFAGAALGLILLGRYPLARRKDSDQ